MNKAEKIKAEIERQKEIHFKDYHINKNGNSADYGACNALTQLLSFIDSLEEEPVSNDLEEACDEYYDETWDEHGGKAMVVDGCHDIWFPSQATDDFYIAGAQWQKEQLMENAVEAVIHPYDGEIWVDKGLLSIYNDCQRVKLIIIEEG